MVVEEEDEEEREDVVVEKEAYEDREGRCGGRGRR